MKKILFFLMIIFLAACGPAATQAPPTLTPIPPAPTVSPTDLVKAYEDAYNRHDIQAAMALLAKEISVDIPGTGEAFSTLQDVQNFHEFYRNQNIETHFTNCQVSGTIVTCKLTYTYDCIKTSGLDMIPGEAVFAISGNKIKTIRMDLDQEKATQYVAYIEKLAAWSAETHPTEWARFWEDIPTKEAATIFSNACKEYGAVQKLDLVKAYEDAYNRHDVAGVMALFAEEASLSVPNTWDSPTRQDIQALHEYASGLNGETHLTDCQVSGDTVTCKQSTADDCVRSAGLMIPGKATFTIDQGKIKKVLFDWPADDPAQIQYGAHGEKFHSWYKETYPTEYAKIFGDFQSTRETGSTIGGRCKEYGAIN